MRKRVILTTAAVLLVAGAAIAVAAPRVGCAGGWHERGEGPRGGRAMMMLQQFDADGNGALTRAEIEAVRDDAYDRFDADGDGALTLDEFEGYWAEFSRPRMVDRFQQFDEDGDGRITAAEVDERIDRMFAWGDRNDDGELSPEDRRRR